MTVFTENLVPENANVLHPVPAVREYGVEAIS